MNRNPPVVLSRLKKGWIDYGRLLWDYRLLFVAGIILFVPSLFLPIMTTSPSPTALCNVVTLCAHGTTPWGAVTSMFLYDSWTNVPTYFFILAAYVAFSDRVDFTERRRRAQFGSVAIFCAATVANLLWIHFLPLSYSWGPSGVVYALWGWLLAFNLFDGMPKNPRSLNPKTWFTSKQEHGSAMGSLMVFSMTAVMLVSGPAVFLSSSPGVNVFAHGISFMGGYGAAHIYRWRRIHGLLW